MESKSDLPEWLNQNDAFRGRIAASDVIPYIS